MSCYCFFFNDTATTEIYTLSLHDALPISDWLENLVGCLQEQGLDAVGGATRPANALRFIPEYCGHRRLMSQPDRKSTRLNSSHANISYAVFCLKKKTPSSILSFPSSSLLP